MRWNANMPHVVVAVCDYFSLRCIGFDFNIHFYWVVVIHHLCQILQKSFITRYERVSRHIGVLINGIM